jgi:hypothetical protein
MKHITQFWSEFVEYVSRVSEARQENDRLSGAAPVKHLQLDVLIHSQELCGVWRLVGLFRVADWPACTPEFERPAIAV